MADNQKSAEARAVKVFACVNGFMALVMAAVAAHALSDPLAAELAQKASTYQLAHSLLLLILASHAGNFFTASRWMIVAGIVFFCGALYTHALMGIVPVIPLAPFGGICLMLGWLLAAYAFMKEGKDNG